MIKISIKDKLNRFLNGLRRKRGYNHNYGSRTNFYRKQFYRIIICIVIVLTVLIIKKINVKLTNNIIRIVDESINYSFDVKEDTKRIFDFVRDKIKIPDNVIETFSSDVSN